MKIEIQTVLNPSHSRITDNRTTEHQSNRKSSPAQPFPPKYTTQHNTTTITTRLSHTHPAYPSKVKRWLSGNCGWTIVTVQQVSQIIHHTQTQVGSPCSAATLHSTAPQQPIHPPNERARLIRNRRIHREGGVSADRAMQGPVLYI